MSLRITFFRLLPHFPGAIDLINNKTLCLITSQPPKIILGYSLQTKGIFIGVAHGLVSLQVITRSTSHTGHTRRTVRVHLAHISGQPQFDHGALRDAVKAAHEVDLVGGFSVREGSSCTSNDSRNAGSKDIGSCKVEVIGRLFSGQGL